MRWLRIAVVLLSALAFTARAEAQAIVPLPPAGERVYPNATPYAPDPDALLAYESSKKNPGGAAVLSILVFPGVGNVYAGHAEGALAAWGMIIAGFVVMGASARAHPANTPGLFEPAPFVASLFMITGAFVYSAVDAYQSANEYNRRLRRQLGLPDVLPGGLAFSF